MVNIRKFNIDFTAENILPDGSVPGFQGEHNATTLSIIPPDEMTNCEDIVAYKVAFELNNCRHTRSELLEKTSPVTVLLSSQITSSKEISVQLEGYGADGNLFVKSPKVEKLIFEDSVGGECVDFDGQSGTAADITANTLARHTHENAEVLNNLAENENGNLTYKGEEIKGGGGSGERKITEPIEFILDFSDEPGTDICEAQTSILMSLADNNSVTEESLLLCAGFDAVNDLSNKEVAKIEFNFDNGDESKWIDINDFIQDKPAFPYYINVNRSFRYLNSRSIETVCFGVISYIGINLNRYLTDIKNCNEYGFRVSFYED